MAHSDTHTAFLISVKGLVQGVGFRPFIYRLAQKYQVRGWVENRNDGVRIHAEALDGVLNNFVQAIREESPQASDIRSITFEVTSLESLADFRIKKSEGSSAEITEISPDIAVCDKCLEDMKSQSHRLHYPFINCTNCGPRFTIISDLPYDRHKTTMRIFQMCPVCRSEYEEVMDRRFHAQPVACNDCGPHYHWESDGIKLSTPGEICSQFNQEIREGKIIALKGLGGFHLACDGFNERAVRELRTRKNRDGKPFAVMFKNLDSLEKLLLVNATERKELLSWRRPIVILQNKPGPPGLAPSVSNGFGTTGAMLPYMPFHHLLFEHLDTEALVLTSGNISDEPILIDNDEALISLKPVTESMITYNRDILNRTDDSVLMVTNQKKRMIRRSRGYVPSPIQTSLDTEGIFAAGAELVNCFCIGKGDQALLSQHIGDLKNLETLEFYREAIDRFRMMFRFEPKVFAVDMHPDYLSRKFSLEWAARIPGSHIEQVQHHHAHVASCMAEHGLDERVIGISLDGVGFGPDGNIWGFEIMTCDLVDFQRVFHPEYIPQPGGDVATREPWRMAVSYLYHVYGESFRQLPLPFLETIPSEKINIMVDLIRKKINAPLTCSAGRLFDAVAAMTGICTQSNFHAEAPMRLEQMADPDVVDHYPYEIGDVIKLGPMIQGIVEDLKNHTGMPVISARFHHTVISILVESCKIISARTGIHKVVLSGGTFQNRFMISRLENKLLSLGLDVYSQESVPSNDGGIALGQLVIASKRRALKT